MLILPFAKKRVKIIEKKNRHSQFLCLRVVFKKILNDDPNLGFIVRSERSYLVYL